MTGVQTCALPILLNARAVFSVGSAIAFVAILFLWLIFAVFNRIGKTQKLIALGTSFLLAIPFMFVINAVLSKMTAEPILDVWDMLTVFLLLIFAFVFFICDYAKKKGVIK